jgi:hypothetical protein
MDLNKNNRQINNMDEIRKWIRNNRKSIDIGMIVLLILAGELSLALIFLLVFVIDWE